MYSAVNPVIFEYSSIFFRNALWVVDSPLPIVNYSYRSQTYCTITPALNMISVRYSNIYLSWALGVKKPLHLELFTVEVEVSTGIYNGVWVQTAVPFLYRYSNRYLCSTVRSGFRRATAVLINKVLNML